MVYARVQGGTGEGRAVLARGDLPGLGAVEEDCAEGEQPHQDEPSDKGAAAECVFLLLNQGERAADEDEATGVGAVDALGDSGDAHAGAGLPGELVALRAMGGDAADLRPYWQKASRRKRQSQRAPMECQYQAAQSTMIWWSSTFLKAYRPISAAIRPATPTARCMAWATVMM